MNTFIFQFTLSLTILLLPVESQKELEIFSAKKTKVLILPFCVDGIDDDCMSPMMIYNLITVAIGKSDQSIETVSWSYDEDLKKFCETPDDRLKLIKKYSPDLIISGVIYQQNQTRIDMNLERFEIGKSSVIQAGFSQANTDQLLGILSFLNKENVLNLKLDKKDIENLIIDKRNKYCNKGIKRVDDSVEETTAGDALHYYHNGYFQDALNLFLAASNETQRNFQSKIDTCKMEIDGAKWFDNDEKRRLWWHALSDDAKTVLQGQKNMPDIGRVSMPSSVFLDSIFHLEQLTISGSQLPNLDEFRYLSNIKLKMKISNNLNMSSIESIELFKELKILLLEKNPSLDQFTIPASLKALQQIRLDYSSDLTVAFFSQWPKLKRICFNLNNKREETACKELVDDLLEEGLESVCDCKIK